jgi:hypothetical protein
MEGQQQARAQGEQHKQAPAAMLESAELAKKHRSAFLLVVNILKSLPIL